MAFLKRLRAFVTGAGYRQDGLQQGSPASYYAPSSTPVTVDTSLQISAVWACVKLLSENIASLPINVYKVDRKTGIRTLDYDHPLHKLLNGKPNRWQTKQEFFETLNYQLFLMGNNYTAVERNSRGDPVSLVPLMSEQMEVELEEGKKVFRYQESSNVKFYSDSTVWHNKLFGNGIIGLSPLEYGKTSIGIAAGAEQSVSKIYRNGGKPSGTLSIDHNLTDEQKKRIKENFSDMADGNENRLFVLEAGFKYQQISLSPQDIELLESRRFQIEDIARFFGVPSILINDTKAGTTWGSGIDQIIQGFYKFTIRPTLERYEASMKCFFLSPEERLNYDIEFDFDKLLQPDYATRVRTGGEATQKGLITINEWRAGEGKQPVEGGDKAYMQGQMYPISELSTGSLNEQEQT